MDCDIERICPDCQGTGMWSASQLCARCDGSGVITRETPRNPWKPDTGDQET